MVQRYRPKVADPSPAKASRARPTRKKLTDKNVTTLPARSRQYLVWDDTTGKDGQNGLAVLVSPRAIRSFRCVYYFPGSAKPHWKHLGRVGEMSLEDAREATREARGMARKGEDPRAADPMRSDSFRTIVENYIQHVQIGELGNKSALDTQAVLLNSTKDWHARPVATIRYSEVEKLLWVIRDGDEARSLRARPYLANRLHAHLRHLFEWAARPSGPLRESPMVGMKKPWNKEASRDRDWFKGKAGDDAIRAIWRAADEMGGREGQYLKLLLLTGKRPGQTPSAPGLAPMRWEHITDDWFWDPPASASKNKRLHGIPLSRLAQRQLHPRETEGKVFGDLDQSRDNFKRLLHRVRKATGIEDFILHGLRHLAETKLAALKVAGDGKFTEAKGASGRPVAPPHIRDLLFDHAPARGAGQGYDHHDYADEMRAAMEAWASYIEQLVQPAEGVARLR